MIDGLTSVRSRIAQLQALTGAGSTAGGGVALGGMTVSSGLATGSSALAGATGSTFATGTTTTSAPSLSAEAFADALTGAMRSTSTRPGGDTKESTAERVVDIAKGYTGIPYLWGGTNPDKGLDCSGLTQLVYRQVGVDLPRVSRDQAKVGRKVDSLEQARPGDLVFFNSPVSHVGIYLGNGKMLDAPRRGKDVGVHEVWGTPSHIRRVLPADSWSDGASAGVAAASTARASSAGASGKGSTGGLDGPYADLFTRSGRKHGVDPALLSAVAKAESGYDPTARSSAGARGLMQLMPGTARELGVDAFDPAEAVDGAARLLAKHLRSYGGRVDLALAAYNAGPGNVAKYGGIPPFEETQTYVKRVTRTWESLR